MVDGAKNKEDWEKLWKKFSEIVGFTHDNEGVISSMENQKKFADSPKMKETLSEQEEEIAKLIKHHEKDLAKLLQQAKKMAKELQLSVESELSQIEKALKEHDVEKLEKEVKKIAKK